MKRIEDIENMSIAELQEKASGLDVKVPAELQTRIGRKIDGYRRRRAAVTGNAVAACLVAALLCSVITGISLGSRMAAEPADSFTDPRQAYEEVEKALGMVSMALNTGAASAAQSRTCFEQARSSMDNILK